jgi:microcystin-dependent protein
MLIIYTNYKYIENFDNTDITDEEKNIIKNLSPHLLAIKNLSDLANSLMKNGKLIVPGALNIKGDINIDGKMNYFPKGCIIMWTGSIAPSGWVLCDGSNETPDLRGRFILGMGKGNNLTSRQINDKGGLETVNLTVDNLPSHNHGFKNNTINQLVKNTYARGVKDQDNWFRGVGANETNDLMTPLQNIITDNQGNNKSHENMPPFYTLAFIMKL